MNNVTAWILRLVIAVGLSLNVAHAEEVVAVIVNPTYQGEISSGIVRSIYLGENRSLMPVAQAVGSFDRQVFLDGVLKMNESHFKRHWSKLIFSGAGRPPNNLSSRKAVLSWVASNPMAIGYVDSSLVDSSVEVVILLRARGYETALSRRRR